MAFPFFTIGHSTRSATEFIDLLKARQVRVVVDVGPFRDRAQIRNSTTTSFRRRWRKSTSAMSGLPRSEGCAQSSMRLHQA